MSDNSFKQSEPSMEDILASIRRIIAEEDEQEQHRDARSRAADLDLTEDRADAEWREAGSGWAGAGSGLIDEAPDSGEGTRATSLDTRAVETADGPDDDSEAESDWLDAANEDDDEWAWGEEETAAEDAATETTAETLLDDFDSAGAHETAEDSAIETAQDPDESETPEPGEVVAADHEEAARVPFDASGQDAWDHAEDGDVENGDEAVFAAEAARIDDPDTDEPEAHDETAAPDGDVLYAASESVDEEGDAADDLLDLGPALPEGSVEDDDKAGIDETVSYTLGSAAPASDTSFLARFEAAALDDDSHEPTPAAAVPSLDDGALELGDDLFGAEDIDDAARADTPDDEDVLELTERMIGDDSDPATETLSILDDNETDDEDIAGDNVFDALDALEAEAVDDLLSGRDDAFDPFEDTLGEDTSGEEALDEAATGENDAGEHYGMDELDEDEDATGGSIGDAALLAAAISESRELAPVPEQPRRRRSSSERRAVVAEDEEAARRAARRARLDADDRIMSGASEAAAARAFAALTGGEDGGRRVHAGMGIAANGGDSLEDIVREMLTPLLQEWLDENLPEVVERSVRAEVERISARSRHYR